MGEEGADAEGEQGAMVEWLEWGFLPRLPGYTSVL